MIEAQQVIYQAQQLIYDCLLGMEEGDAKDITAHDLTKALVEARLLIESSEDTTVFSTEQQARHEAMTVATIALRQQSAWAAAPRTKDIIRLATWVLDGNAMEDYDGER